MSAILNCYWDEACTDPVYFDAISYHIDLGPKNGLNGDAGEVYDQTVWVKNEGDVMAQGPIVRESGDAHDYFKLSSEIYQYRSFNTTLPNLDPGESTWFTIHSIVPKGTGFLEGIIKYTIEFYTIPAPPEPQEYTDYDAPEHKLYYTGDNPIPDPPESKAGRPYGYGPYGDPIYGQEGLYKLETVIDGYIPIAGLAYTYINGSFKINARYDGTEATIEDVQSYYTRRYMALRCFDGPALPLWLDTGER